jgi:acyl-coenzyme A thioesterase PaaI-like protein
MMSQIKELVAQNLTSPPTPFDIANGLRRVSPTASRKLLDFVIPRIIPLAKGLDVQVAELTDTRCVLLLPGRRRTRNHLGTMYFGAQMTLIDLTVGVILFSRFPPGPFGGVIKRVETDFLVKARGSIRGVCDIPLDTVDALEQVRVNSGGKVEAWVPVELIDPTGTVVTRANVLVAVKRFSKK